MEMFKLEVYQAMAKNNNKIIKGMKAEYDGNRYFEYQGSIYKRLEFDVAYKINFEYPKVDVCVDL